METIVVGVDGSECAGAALAFAAAEAALRRAKLRVVSAWEVPMVAYGGGFAPPLDEATFDAFGDRAQSIVDDAAATAKTLHPSLECEARSLEGQPAAVLLEQAADASLIVVGNRGLGGFKSLLLGSVSQQVAHTPPAPSSSSMAVSLLSRRVRAAVRLRCMRVCGSCSRSVRGPVVERREAAGLVCLRARMRRERSVRCLPVC